MSKNIFITGTTGFLGSFLAKEFLDKGYNIFALARAKGNKSAQERIEDALKFAYEDKWNPEFISSHLKVIEGDITQRDLGIKSNKAKEFLESETDIIFHSAALAELRIPLDIIRKINVEGTRNVLDFALKCAKKGKLKKVNHISTAYVVGTKKGINFSEDMLELGQGFHNTYEQSKYEAEILVKKYQKKGLKISVFRPSMIMGCSKKGKTNNFRLIYEPLHFFSQEIYKEFPANLECYQNLINIDTVAQAISLLGERHESRVYHVTSSKEITIDLFMRSVSEYFGFKLPDFTPVEEFDFKQWTPVQNTLAEPYIPYFNYSTRFSSNRIQNVLKEYDFTCPPIDKDNLVRAFEYCHKRGFVKRKN